MDQFNYSAGSEKINEKVGLHQNISGVGDLTKEVMKKAETEIVKPESNEYQSYINQLLQLMVTENASDLFIWKQSEKPLPSGRGYSYIEL